jgi:hypothetical protein
MAELSVRKRKEVKLPTKWAQDNIHVAAYRCFTNYLEDEGITILRNVGNYFPQKKLVTSQKTYIFINSAVRNPKIAIFK